MTQLLAPPKNSTALASQVLGIVSYGVGFVVCLVGGGLATGLIAFAVAALPALVAVILGFVGLSTANRLGGVRRKQAIVGIVLGFTPWLAVLLGLIARPAILGY